MHGCYCLSSPRSSLDLNRYQAVPMNRTHAEAISITETIANAFPLLTSPLVRGTLPVIGWSAVISGTIDSIEYRLLRRNDPCEFPSKGMLCSGVEVDGRAPREKLLPLRECAGPPSEGSACHWSSPSSLPGFAAHKAKHLLGIDEASSA